MSSEIKKFEKAELSWNGKRVRSTHDEVMIALAPIFVAFPNAKMADETLNLYVMMLQDVDPQTLSCAVVAALGVCKFFPTIAEIRTQVDAMKRAPGPHSEVDPCELKPIPTKFFRLDEEEDRLQRMERLRRTEKWSKYYEH